jgi:hypothetical protein
VDADKPSTITLYSYSKVWKIEKKIYAVQNFTLPVPVDPWQILYFVGTWIVCSVIFGVIPGFTKIPVVLRSIALPLAISRFLMTKKMDGKNPLRFILGIIVFLFTEQGKCVERFVSVPENQKIVKLEWNCSEGVRWKET